MMRSSEEAIENERVQNITMHVGGNNSRDWSWGKKAWSRLALYTAWRACQELDGSEGLEWNHERCSLSNRYLSHKLTCPITQQRQDRNNVHAIDQNVKSSPTQSITLASSRSSCPPSTPPQMSFAAPSCQLRTLAAMPRAAPYQRGPL